MNRMLPFGFGSGRFKTKHRCDWMTYHAGVVLPSESCQYGTQTNETSCTRMSALLGLMVIVVKDSVLGSIFASNAAVSLSNSACRSLICFWIDSTVSPARSTSLLSLIDLLKPRMVVEALLIVELLTFLPVKAPNSVLPREIAVWNFACLACSACFSTACCALRNLSCRVAFLGPYFLRSCSTSRSRCSRASCCKRIRNSPSLSPGLEASFRLGLWKRSNFWFP
jgi:hypothetical protein